MFVFDLQNAFGHLKDTLYQKIAKESAVKQSMKKPILLNLVNLPTIFCSRLFEETQFHF